MQLKEFDIILNIKDPVKTAEHIEFVQGDSNSCVLNITMVDGLKPYNLSGTKVQVIFYKADKTTVQQTDSSGIGIMDYEKGMIRCVLKTNSIAYPGRVLAEVKILEGDTLLTSALFDFKVRKSLLNDETIESTNEFPILTELISTTEDLIDRVSGIEEQVPANVITRIEGIENSKIDKASIVQNATSTNPETVASGPVARELQRQITEQNNNLAFTKVVSKSYLLQGQENIQLSPGLFLVVAQISLAGSPASVSLVGVTGSVYSITKLHENMNITLSKAGAVLSVAMVGGYQWDLRVYKLV